jgi:hypothetical protein
MDARTVSTVIGLCTIAVATAAGRQTPPDLLSRIDHLVYAAPDLDRGVRDIEARLGVRAVPGGQHPGLGTRNALVALGPESYLEIFAPDPDQPPPPRPRAFEVDTLRAPRLIAWFVRGQNLEHLRTTANAKGIPVGEIRSASRRTPEGLELSWQFTDPRKPVADGIVPFFIDWGRSPHPARSAARGASLVSLRAEHPNAVTVQRMLRELEVELPVVRGPQPVLIAVIDGPRGRVELRSDE